MMGHNIITARAITSKCGIIKSGDSELVMVAIEFNKRVRDTIINEVVAVTEDCSENRQFRRRRAWILHC